ncbi:unnamed protein product [Ilex paraguariensis]|uniref:Uncharacterized protein n=1 Tax=Ilex paraguariensis TaxID=185542 RepID=A0ABC8U9S2_9AQUA
MPSEDSKPVKKEEVEDEEDEKCLGSVFQNRKKKPDNATAKSGSPKEGKVKKEVGKLKKEKEDYDFEEPTTKKSSKKADKVCYDFFILGLFAFIIYFFWVLNDDFVLVVGSGFSFGFGLKVQKKKKVKEEEKKKKGANKVEQNPKKRERKEYDLPGQKRDPPEERDPLRIFYETLYEQVPNSDMAAFWMMEFGLLSKEVAKKVFERKQKKIQQQKLGSPVKTVVTVKKKAESVTVTRKTSSSRVLTKKTTSESKVMTKQSKKRKMEDTASDNESDDDFLLASTKSKKQRAA